MDWDRRCPIGKREHEGYYQNVLYRNAGSSRPRNKRRKEGGDRADLDESVDGEDNELWLGSGIVDEVEVDQLLLFQIVGLLLGVGAS